MIDEYFGWLHTFFDWPSFWFAILAGVFFGFYVFYKGDDDSTWRDIVGWGVAVYLTFITLANLHRFVGGEENRWLALNTTTIRWFAFIFTIVLVAGILRGWWRLHRRRFGAAGLLGTLKYGKDD